jgi:hypothetical protein
MHETTTSMQPSPSFRPHPLTSVRTLKGFEKEKLMNEFKISEFKPKKTAARMKIINRIVSSLSNEKVFKGVLVENWNEKELSIQLNNFLREGMKKIFKDLYPHQTVGKIEKRVDKAILWERASDKTIRANPIFGTRHRPDFAVHIRDLKIAVEIKKGGGGDSLRGGIGQCLIYSMDYDFVIYLYIDVSDGRTVKTNSAGERESYLIRSLWERYNIWLVIV